MKSSLEKVSELERKLNITVPQSTVANAFDKMFKGIQKQASIKGFRQGKAPMATVKTMYKDRVQQDVIQDLVQKHYFDALQAEKIEPISYPEFEFDAVDESKDFQFTALFEVKPEITLKKYEGLEVEKEAFTASDEKVKEILENIRTSRAETVPVLEDRPAQKGDTAVIDFEGFVDGKPMENGAGTNHHLELGANQFIEGFEAGVEGMKIGSEKTLSLKFPTPYHAAELAGKPVEFKVKLVGLKKKQLPELNDEFVAKMMGNTIGSPGETHTLESLKKTIRDDIEQSEKKRIETDLKNRLLKKLVAANPVNVPPSMLKDQKQALIEDTQKRLKEQGLPETQFEDYKAKWDKDFENTAAEMIQSGFLIDAIAKKHDLGWKPADLENKMEEYAKQTGIDLARIKEFYGTPEQKSRLTYMITEEKVIAFLMSSATVKEVPKEKLKDLAN